MNTVNTAPKAVADAAAALSSLSDPLRLRILGLLAGSAPEPVHLTLLADRLGLSTRECAMACSKLVNAGLLRREGTAFAFDPSDIRRLVSNLDSVQVATAKLPRYPSLQGLFAHGRLTTWPALGSDAYRDLLDFTLECLPGRWPLTESVLNEQLRGLTDDPAQLRRLLIDSKRLARTRDGRQYTVGPRAAAHE